MTAPFQFKQFVVHQDQCAMKVGTDGILLGAWAHFESPVSILDIGCGSGLIALMMAQRFPTASITAVEITSDSAVQAEGNFARSPWADRLHVVHGDARELTHDHKFDLIVANPPYFEDSLVPHRQGRRAARHTDTLSHSQLVGCVGRLLTDNGQFAVVLPSNVDERFCDLCEQARLHCSRKCLVHPTPGAVAKRVLLQFGRTPELIRPSESLIVECSRHEYSSEYKQLTADFYLKH